MSDRDFYRRLYKLDPEHIDDWGSIVGSKDPGRMPAPTYSNWQLLQLDYLKTVFKRDTVYSYPAALADVVPEEGVQADGHHIFQVLSVHTSQSRPRIVPTHATRTRHSVGDPQLIRS